MCIRDRCNDWRIPSAAFHATLRLAMQRLDECFENGILIFMLHSDRRSGAFAVSLAHAVACAAGRRAGS